MKQLILRLLRTFGYEVHRVPRRMVLQPVITPKYNKIHYGSGRVYLDDWLNVDIIASGPENYMYLDLTGRHPFPDNSFEYAFSEDFIEHIDQASSLMFLVEVHRTLKPGGVLRITTPELGKVLRKHYRSRDYLNFETGREEAYSSLGHIHFFSEGSLRTVAEFIGFEVKFVEGGVSEHAVLNGVNTRSDEVYLHAELTKCN